jgi:hypothetical protein
MIDLYETFQNLYDRLERREHGRATGPVLATARVAVAGGGRIADLRGLKDEFQRVAAGLEEALFELQNEGKVDPQLSLALSIANHCAAGSAQLLVAAIDGSEEIRASSDAMRRATEKLAAIGKKTKELIENLDQITGVLTTAGKVLELIKA